MAQKISKFRGKYFFLSNFYPCEVEYEGVIYPTVEHAFQAAKTPDLREREMIRALPTPGDAKRRGKHVKLRRDWEGVKVGIMTELVRDKFSRPSSDSARPCLGSMLIGTGNAHLEEGNTWGDRFWGTCDGRGKNILGKILMQVRDELE